MKCSGLVPIFAGLFTLSCVGQYQYQHNPDHFNFVFTNSDMPGNPNFVSGIVIVMINTPLYFTDKSGNRDYLRDLSFHILKRTDGTYEVAYDINATRSSTDIWLKAAPQEQVDAASQELFPYFFKSTGEVLRGAVRKIPSLYALREDRDNKELFKNSMNLINFFLPINKLAFDENDLNVAIPPLPTGVRAWFSLDAWRNWWRVLWFNEIGKR